MTFFESAEFFSRNEKLYQRYREKIQALLPQSKIEHIGASAIRGAISKGDLDIFVGVDQSVFEHALEKIKAIGFEEKSDTLKTESLRMLVPTEIKDDVAIQLVAKGSKFEFFITFRDALLANPDQLEAYNELKLNCVDMVEDDYRKVKSDFISKVLEKS